MYTFCDSFSIFLFCIDICEMNFISNQNQCITAMLKPVWFRESKFKDRFQSLNDMVDAITLAKGIPYDAGFYLNGGYMYDSAIETRDEDGLPIPAPWYRINHHADPDMVNCFTQGHYGKGSVPNGLRWYAKRDIEIGEELFYNYGDVPVEWSSSYSIEVIQSSMQGRKLDPDGWQRKPQDNLASCDDVPVAETQGVEKYFADPAIIIRDRSPPVSRSLFPIKNFMAGKLKDSVAEPGNNKVRLKRALAVPEYEPENVSYQATSALDAHHDITRNGEYPPTKRRRKRGAPGRVRGDEWVHPPVKH
jgi:hypothetical protein